ncbi:MAG: hypothetical protein PHS34_08635 [Candidatus Omnitrophica bacterium]|nr:hypothetical protein [Candidatus Omnitrophota bacterium]
MRNGVGIFKITSLTKSNCRTRIDDIWCLARPEVLPSIKQKIKAIWLILTNQADILIWK